MNRKLMNLFTNESRNDRKKDNLRQPVRRRILALTNTKDITNKTINKLHYKKTKREIEDISPV